MSDPFLSSEKEKSPSTNSGDQKTVIRASGLVMMASFSSYAFRFIGNLILTRLLYPELFGLMTLANVFVQGITMLSDVGLEPSIIQNRRGNEATFLNTAWTLQVLRGLIIWVITILIAQPISSFYGRTELNWLIPMIGLSALVGGFSSTNLIVLKRSLELKRVIVIQLLAQIAGLVVMICWGYFLPSIWALVGGCLMAPSIQVILSHLFCPGTGNRFAWEAASLRSIISYGKWIFLASTIHLLASEVDRLLMGKFFSLELLGIYGIAKNLADMVSMVSSKLAHSVLFPAMSKKYRKGLDLTHPILRYKVGLTSLLMIPLCAMAILGEPLVCFLYDSRYHAAGWMLSLLVLQSMMKVLTNPVSLTLLAIGKPYFAATARFSSFAWTTIGLFIAHSFESIQIGLIVISLAMLPAYVILQFGALRNRIKVLKLDLLIMMNCILCIFPLRALYQLMINWPTPLAFILCSSSVVAMWVAFLFFARRQLKIDGLPINRSFFQHKPDS